MREEGGLVGCNRCHVDFFISVLLSLNTAVAIELRNRDAKTLRILEIGNDWVGAQFGGRLPNGGGLGYTVMIKRQSSESLN